MKTMRTIDWKRAAIASLGALYLLAIMLLIWIVYFQYPPELWRGIMAWMTKQ